MLQPPRLDLAASQTPQNPKHLESCVLDWAIKTGQRIPPVRRNWIFTTKLLQNYCTGSQKLLLKYQRSNGVKTFLGVLPVVASHAPHCKTLPISSVSSCFTCSAKSEPGPSFDRQLQALLIRDFTVATVTSFRRMSPGLSLDLSDNGALIRHSLETHFFLYISVHLWCSSCVLSQGKPIF